MCKRVLKSQTTAAEGIPFFKISTFGGTAESYISEKLYDHYRRKYPFPSKGDILISAAGTLGKTVIYNGAPSYFQDSNIVWIANDESKILNSFLYYYYQTKPWQTTSGSTINRIYNEDLRSLEIQHPDLPTQNKIAAVLSALDAKIALNHRINSELEGMAKLLYDYWFVQYDFPLSAAQAAALGQPHLTGKPYRSSGGPMVFNPQLKREIPEGWETGSLTHLGEIVGGSTPSTKEISFFTDHGTPWITPKDLSRNVGNKFITRGQTDLTESGVKSASLAVLPPGSVLMSSRAPIGYTAINRIPVTTNQGFKSFVPSKCYPVEYVYHTLNHLMGVIEQNASGSTFKEISTGALKAIHTVLPDADIIASYQAVVAPMFQQQDTLEQQNQELTTLRDWLLPMLMNGQVRVGCSESADSRQKGGAK
jgi:type I restriction enzyme S subunit